MTTEEKARAYDEALALMEDCVPDKDGYVCVRPCDIFPELAESEDERIRKWLEETIEDMPENSINFRDVRRIDVLHWLEKQGEQKAAEWSEEDEKMLFNAIDLIGTTTDGFSVIVWLQSLKKRMEEQQ